jgi:hypothetical protein
MSTINNNDLFGNNEQTGTKTRKQRVVRKTLANIEPEKAQQTELLLLDHEGKEIPSNTEFQNESEEALAALRSAVWEASLHQLRTGVIDSEDLRDAIDWLFGETQNHAFDARSLAAEHGEWLQLIREDVYEVLTPMLKLYTDQTHPDWRDASDPEDDPRIWQELINNGAEGSVDPSLYI